MIRVISYAILLPLLLAAISANGQRTLTGRLVDKETGKPVKDASITLIGTDIKTTSNALGFFQVQEDSLIHIEIISSDYPVLQVKLPDVTNFKIELTKASITDKLVDKAYKIYEQPASFPGGMSRFYKYVFDNLKFPKEVRNGAYNGKVIIEFVIDSTGLILPDEVRIKQGLCKTCDEEAIRVVRNSPKWNPGIQKDKPVRVKMTMPIEFRSN